MFVLRRLSRCDYQPYPETGERHQPKGQRLKAKRCDGGEMAGGRMAGKAAWAVEKVK